MKSRPGSDKNQSRRSVSVGLVAPSSRVPALEFKLGLEKVEAAGFYPIVNSQCAKEYLFFAGKDEERARAFVQYALDPRFSIVWLARGGYGIARTLPLIEKMTTKAGRLTKMPKKLLVGYSDATGLQEYVVKKWGWSAVYAPMPGLREFLHVYPNEWNALTRWMRGLKTAEPWGRVQFLRKPSHDIRAGLTGGNLTSWATLVGTKYEPKAAGKIIFLEDVEEPLYRIDRMLQQLWLSGSFHGAKAIVLGNFLNCTDRVGNVLKKKPGSILGTLSPGPANLRPLRKTLPSEDTIHLLFKELGERLGIPVAYGLPVGHGPGHAPLPLGAQYLLGKNGDFKLENWSWLSDSSRRKRPHSGK